MKNRKILLGIFALILLIVLMSLGIRYYINYRETKNCDSWECNPKCYFFEEDTGKKVQDIDCGGGIINYE